MPDQHLHTKKEVPQGSETARKVEVEPVLDNADQWQEAEEEVDDVVLVMKVRFFCLFWGQWGRRDRATGSGWGIK